MFKSLHLRGEIGVLPAKLSLRFYVGTCAKPAKHFYDRSRELMARLATSAATRMPNGSQRLLFVRWPGHRFAHQGFYLRQKISRYGMCDVAYRYVVA